MPPFILFIFYIFFLSVIVLIVFLNSDDMVRGRVVIVRRKEKELEIQLICFLEERTIKNWRIGKYK